MISLDDEGVWHITLTVERASRKPWHPASLAAHFFESRAVRGKNNPGYRFAHPGYVLRKSRAKQKQPATVSRGGLFEFDHRDEEYPSFAGLAATYSSKS
jgi:hypothetical protein